MKRLPLALVPSRGSDVVLACVIALVLLLCAHDAHAQSSDRQRYDIPVLALDSALARFSEISGIDVLLREPAADQSMSNPVQGTFSPAEALHLLLEGSGLVARFTSGRSVIIVPANQAGARSRAPGTETGRNAGHARLSLDMMHVTAPRMIGQTRVGHGNEEFARRLAVRIRSYVAQSAIIEGGQAADLRLATRISPDGTLFDVQIVKGSRRPELDRRIAQSLDGAELALPPPPDLPQPLIFDVSGR